MKVNKILFSGGKESVISRCVIRNYFCCVGVSRVLLKIIFLQREIPLHAIEAQPIF